MEKSVMLVWFLGTCVWCPILIVVWLHGYKAQTFAQASLNRTRLAWVSGFGVVWSVAGAVWLAKLRKARSA
jgi:hypothetical protein